MEAAVPPLARDDTVLVGKSKLLAKVVKAVREGDQTVLVQWESTKTEQEVAIDDVEKLDFDAKPKRQTRGKRSEASGSEAAALARREPPRKRIRKEAAKPAASVDAEADESSSAEEDPVKKRVYALVAVLEENNDYDARREATRALIELSSNNAANSTAVAEALVALLASDNAELMAAGAKAVADIVGNDACEEAPCAAIVKADGIAPLVALLTKGTWDCQMAAARALRNLAQHPATSAKIISFGAIKQLVALNRKGSYYETCVYAAEALARLAKSDEIKAAIIEAGAIEPLLCLLKRLMNYTHHNNEKWRVASVLEQLDITKYLSRLQSENASLKLQLAGDDVVDMRDGDASPPAKKRNALRDAHDEQQSSKLKRVKQENVVTDSVAAAASAAAAKASAAAATAHNDAEEAQDTLGYQVRFTDALQTKIDELHALACQVDPVAADAIKNRLNQ